MSTIGTWIATLPDGPRQRAMANTTPRRRAVYAPDPITALNRAFYPPCTPEGWDYWEGVKQHLRSHGSEPIPEPPESK